MDHIEFIPIQRTHHKVDKGFLVCNSDCAVIGLVIPFAAIEETFGLINVDSVVMEQALSGAWHTSHTKTGGAGISQARATLVCHRWTSLTSLTSLFACLF